MTLNFSAFSAVSAPIKNMLFADLNRRNFLAHSPFSHRPNKRLGINNNNDRKRTIFDNVSDL
jgi:hypothetical protein